MEKFYTRIDGEPDFDEEGEGLEFSDVGAAIDHLRRAAAEIVADEIQKGSDLISLTLQLLDSRRTEIFTLRTAAALDGGIGRELQCGPSSSVPQRPRTY